MKPLFKLSNEEKAKLLHELLPTDIPRLISYIDHTAKYILNNKDRIAKQWKSHTIAPQVWFKLASKARHYIKVHRETLQGSSAIFAYEIFNCVAVFGLHCLSGYVNICSNPQFRDGVKFLFGLEPTTKLFIAL